MAPGGGTAGVSTLTLVLVVPAVVSLIMAVAQFVVYYHASHLATAAAQEGVRAAQLADGSVDDARAHAQDFLAQAGPRLVLWPEVDVTRGDETARVEVRGQAPQIMPGMTIGIRSVATGPVERFVADTAGP